MEENVAISIWPGHPLYEAARKLEVPEVSPSLPPMVSPISSMVSSTVMKGTQPVTKQISVRPSVVERVARAHTAVERVLENFKELETRLSPVIPIDPGVLTGESGPPSLDSPLIVDIDSLIARLHGFADRVAGLSEKVQI